MPRSITLLAATALAVVGLAACGGDDDQRSDPSGSPVTETPGTETPGTETPGTGTAGTDAVPGEEPGDAVPAELVDVEWVLDGHVTIAGLQPLPVADAGASLTFGADGTVAVRTGCNQGSGTATFDGDTLTVGPVRLTRMACTDDDRMQVEQLLLAELEEELTWAVSDHTLSLTPQRVSDRGLHFHDAAHPPADDPTQPTVPGADVPQELVGVRWILDGYFTVGGLQPLPVTDAVAELTFAADGTVALSGGCNQGWASATFDDDLVQLHDVTTTEKACTDDAVMRTEQLMLGQLQEQQRWHVADGTLVLTAATVTDTGLHFYDAAQPPAGAGQTGDTIGPPST